MARIDIASLHLPSIVLSRYVQVLFHIYEEALIHDFDHVSIHPEPQADSFCLVLKILSPKTIKPDWIHNAMARIDIPSLHLPSIVLSRYVQVLFHIYEEALIHDFDHVSIHPEPQADSFCLVLKILSPKTIKPDWIHNAMKEAWVVRCPFTIAEYHSGMFLVRFGCESDRRRVMEGQPWHFDNSLMIFAIPDGPMA
ncbi:hypothetical protein F8388_025044 [Cannabis sativa]|uniref:DUF4283 domain-containing protein n=1 Tax=Cannabis sativa TaxID=3483 RepID=A0A7J6F3G4_CANSA|nr:hypothetical protein F8388_011086 [Cannabis sativa]KAF4377553.1 hypothetical protein F8388_025044 [Cannabis sativa]KAF4388601.1 hypothetical protein G4B88_021512 [Cannabis sativa]